jgi:predicted nuclease of restriction endonuclease-like (RecB) superfamily
MTPIHHKQFEEIAQIIRHAKTKALFDVNKTLIQLYQNIGQQISHKIEQGIWGTNIVEDLAKYLDMNLRNVTGFSARNLWRMKQFYETYKDNSILSPLVTELSWTNNLFILSSTKSLEEREFYLRLSVKERYSKRELARQIRSGLYERVVLSKGTQFPEIVGGKDLREYGFRDNYVLEFLQLPDPFSEKDLRKNILKPAKILFLWVRNIAYKLVKKIFTLTLYFFTANWPVS